MGCELPPMRTTSERDCVRATVLSVPALPFRFPLRGCLRRHQWDPRMSTQSPAPLLTPFRSLSNTENGARKMTNVALVPALPPTC